MMTMHQRSVNVSRVQLLEKLRENLEIHKKEYEEALAEFKARLIEDLQLAVKKVKKTDDVMDLEKFKFKISFPEDHSQDYQDVIEMLEMSTDDTINLDAQSFKAYIKNEWVWQQSFKMTKALYNSVGSSFA